MEDTRLPQGLPGGIAPGLRARRCRAGRPSGRQRIATPVVRIGWPDEFVEHGSVPVLREKHGLTARAAAEKILAALPSRRKASASAA